MRPAVTLSCAMLLLLMTLSGAAAADPVTNPANGHTYELIEADLDWVLAEAAAEARSNAGQHCYLATLTSQEENDFLLHQVLLDEVDIEAWIGARHGNPDDCADDVASSWGGVWVTGEAWSYTNWTEEEPGECEELCVGFTTEDSGEDPGWENAFCEFDPDEDPDDQDLQPYIVECEILAPSERRGCTGNTGCGDGRFDPAREQCDDGNSTSGDGCDAACRIEICGDGVVNNGAPGGPGAEQCDDGGSTAAIDVCNDDCLSCFDPQDNASSGADGKAACEAACPETSDSCGGNAACEDCWEFGTRCDECANDLDNQCSICDDPSE